MIIQKSLLSRLSPSLREAMPNLGDDNTIVRPQFSLVGLPPEPSREIVAVGNTIVNTSFSIDYNIQIANSAGASITLCLLSSGYWKIRIIMAYLTNFLQAGAAPDVSFNFFRPIGLDTWVRLWSTLTPVAQYVDTEVEIMVGDQPSVATQLNVLQIATTANTVGQTSNLWLTVLGNKYL